MSKRKKTNSVTGIHNQEVKQFIAILNRRASNDDSMDDHSTFWRISERVSYPEELAKADCIEHTTNFEQCKIYFNSNRIIKVERKTTKAA